MTDPRLWALARAAGWTLAAPLVVRLSPAHLARLGPVARRRTTTAHEADVRKVVDRLRTRAAARRPDGDCLAHSLVLYRVLGGPIDLVLGAGLVDGELRGHAWLERDGVAWLEARDPRTWCTEMMRVAGARR